MELQKTLILECPSNQDVGFEIWRNLLQIQQ